MSAWDRFDSYLSRAIGGMLGILVLVLVLLIVVIVGVAVGGFHLLKGLS